MAAVRINDLPDQHGYRKRSDEETRRALAPVVRPANFPVGRPGAVRRVSASQQSSAPAHDWDKRLPIIAVGIVVPLAVLAVCLCLPRRESVRPVTSPVVPQPMPAVQAAVVAVVDTAAPVDRNNPEPPRQQEPAVVPVSEKALAREEQRADNEDRMRQFRQRFHELVDEARVREEKPVVPLLEAKADQQRVAAAVKEAAGNDPLPPPRPPGECQECKGALLRGDYGTALHFAKDPQEAAEKAAAENKLMVIFTISGNFEDSKFT